MAWTDPRIDSLKTLWADGLSASEIAGKLGGVTPTHTRRSEESQQLQQFSTPIELGFIASLAAAVAPGDLVLEPSAGTGQLAVFAEGQGAQLALNEIADTRADLLTLLFPSTPVTRFNAEQIHDYLPPAVRPTLVLMNPPFSAALNVRGAVAGIDLRHLRSALYRLSPGGRLVAITGINLSPDNPDYRDAFANMARLGRVVFSAGIAGSLYRRHGTTVETRLTVIDRVAADPPSAPSPCHPMADSPAVLLKLITGHLPPRAASEPTTAPTPSRLPQLPLVPAKPRPLPSPSTFRPKATAPAEPPVEVSYSCLFPSLRYHVLE
jgi:hypothetical protein